MEDNYRNFVRVLFEGIPSMPQKPAKPGYKWHWTGQYWDEVKMVTDKSLKDDDKNKPKSSTGNTKPPVKYKNDGE